MLKQKKCNPLQQSNLLKHCLTLSRFDAHEKFYFRIVTFFILSGETAEFTNEFERRTSCLHVPCRKEKSDLR